jgi:hypothetical protein
MPEDEVWSDDLNDTVQRVRFTDGREWWDTAGDVVPLLSQEKRDHLARIGLVELVQWAHKIDRDANAPCFGEMAVRQRWPDMLPPLEDDEE